MKENFFKRLWSQLSDKRQLSMRDRESDEPHWKVNTTPIGLASGIAALLIIIVTILMILMAYTPILEVFPGYKTRSERMHDDLVKSIMQVDSIQRLMGRMIEYNDAVTKIINGSTPTLSSMVTTDSTKQETKMALPTRADSLLRSILERESGEYSLRNTREANPVAAMFSSPLKGSISRHFDAQNSSYGISIMGIDAEHTVTAIENGTVVGVLQGTTGYTTVIILHGEGYTSSYSQLGEALVRKGQSVKSGTAIGRLAKNGDKVLELEFELWRNGTAVDPERYILLK